MNDDARDYAEEQYNRELLHPMEELYCDYCERDGHTFRSCPARDDESGCPECGATADDGCTIGCVCDNGGVIGL